MFAMVTSLNVIAAIGVVTHCESYEPNYSVLIETKGGFFEVGRFASEYAANNVMKAINDACARSTDYEVPKDIHVEE